MSQPYSLFSYVHKGNPLVEFIMGVNSMLLNIIGDIEQELLDISMKTTSREMCENFRNIFGSRDVFQNKMDKAFEMLREANVEKQEYPKLYEKLDQLMHAHEESEEIMRACVETIKESKLPDDEKADLINMFKEAELGTKELDPSLLWEDTAKALNKLIKRRGPADREQVLKDLARIGAKHLENHTMYNGKKEIIKFIQKSTLPRDEKAKLITIFKASEIKDAPLQQNTYMKLLQLMKEKGIVYDARDRKGQGYLNEDIRVLVSTSGEFHVLYPEEYIDLFEGIPGKDGKRHGGLLLEAAIRSGERSEYSITQLRSIAITQEKVNGIMEDNEGQNSIFNLKNLPAAIVEKVIRENSKQGKLILAREESPETKGKDVPFKDRKYDLYVIAGDTNDKKDKNYSELVRLLTIAAYTTTGHIGQQYEAPRMTVTMREHLAATRAIESVGEKDTQKGYLIPIVNNKVYDPVTGRDKEIIKTGNYYYFDKHSISEINEDQTVKKKVNFPSEDMLKNSLYLNYKSGTGEKVFVSEQEYNRINAKVPEIRKMIMQAMDKEAKDDISKYVEAEMTRIQEKVKTGYKSEKSEINDRKKFENLGKIKEALKSDDPRTVVNAVLYGTELRYLDESQRGHFEKNDAKESGNKNLAKDTAVAREVLLSTPGKLHNEDIFNRLMAQNLKENHSFRKEPDDLTKEQNNFLYHEISRMKENGAFNLTAPYVGRDGTMNEKAVMEAVRSALGEIRATAKTQDEIDRENEQKSNDPGNSRESYADVRRQDAAAFEYGYHLADISVPEGEAKPGEIDVAEAKEIMRDLHDTIDDHIKEANGLFDNAELQYEKTEDSMDYNEVDYKYSVKKMQMVNNIEGSLEEVNILNRETAHEERARADEIDIDNYR